MWGHTDAVIFWLSHWALMNSEEKVITFNNKKNVWNIRGLFNCCQLDQRLNTEVTFLVVFCVHDILKFRLDHSPPPYPSERWAQLNYSFMAELGSHPVVYSTTCSNTDLSTCFCFSTFSLALLLSVHLADCLSRTNTACKQAVCAPVSQTVCLTE